MSRENFYNPLIEAARLGTGTRIHPTLVVSTSAEYVLTADCPSLVGIVAGAAIDVLMPAIDAQMEGRMIIIVNLATGANAITVKTSADGALTPAVDVLQNEAVIMVCLNQTWRALVGANT